MSISTGFADQSICRPVPVSDEITAVDSSLLISIWEGQVDAVACADLLERCKEGGALVICEAAAAEVAAYFDSAEELEAGLGRLSIALVSSTFETAFTAGQIHRRYRRSGGTREKMIADFMIGAHALHQADRLAAADRGYLRAYFQDLTVLQPV